jgi:hypothetical protein
MSQKNGNINIEEKIKHSHYYKFQGIAPEGFMLIPEEALERLKDFDTWKEWKHDSSVLTDIIKEITLNLHK